MSGKTPGKTPGQAAYEVWDNTMIAEGLGSIPWNECSWPEVWEAAAQAAIATVDEWHHYHHAVMIERDEAREQLAITREYLASLAADLESSAAQTSPSKKSETEFRCAQAVRGVASGITTEATP